MTIAAMVAMVMTNDATGRSSSSTPASFAMPSSSGTTLVTIGIAELTCSRGGGVQFPLSNGTYGFSSSPFLTEPTGFPVPPS
jgi:hypothetical protein